MALWMSLTTPFSCSCSDAACPGGSPKGQSSGEARNRSRSSKELSRGAWGSPPVPGASGLPSARGALERLCRSSAGPCSGTENMQCKLREARSRRPPGSAGSDPPASRERKERLAGAVGAASGLLWLTAGYSRVYTAHCSLRRSWAMGCSGKLEAEGWG